MIGIVLTRNAGAFLSFGRLFSLYLLCTLFANSTSAQRLEFQKFEGIDGLFPEEVKTIVQDNDGFLWFAGDDRASRFDGKHFVNFTLSIARCSTMYKDRTGRVWFYGAARHLAYYSNGSIHEFEYNNVLDSVKGSAIRSMYIDSENSVWLGLGNSPKSQLPSFIKVDTMGELHKYFPDSNKQGWQLKQIEDTCIHAVKYSPTTDKNLLFHLERDDKKQQFASPKLLEKQVYYYGDRYFFISRYQGIVEIGDSFRHFESLKGLTFLSAFMDNKGRLFIPNERGGVSCFDSLDFDLEPELLLEGVQVRSIFQSRDGGYWFGANNSVYHVPNFEHRILDASTGLPSGKMSFVQRHNGATWITYKQGVVVKLQRGTERKLDIVSYDFRSLLHACYIQGSTALFGGPYIPKTPNEFPYRIRCIGASRCIKPYSNELAYFTGGLAIHEWSFKNDDRLLTYRVGQKVKSLFRLGSHHYLYSDKGGVHVLNSGETQNLSDLDTVFSKPTVDIISIGGNWFAIPSVGFGLIFLRYDGEVRNFFTYKDKGTHCGQLFKQENGILWLVTEQGLQRIAYNLKTDTILLEGNTRLRPEQGMPRNEILNLYADETSIWITTINGCKVIPVDGEQADSRPLKPTITMMQHHMESLRLEEITGLEYSSNSSTIQFISPAFTVYDSIKYKYKLVGYDREWKHSDVGSATYYAIAPGAYEFQVLATNSIGQESTAAVLELVIGPKLWQTWWFKTMAISLLTLGCVLLIYFRIKQTRHRKHLIEEIKSYRNKSLRLQMNPHFIFNALSSIQSFVLKEESRLSSKYIVKFSRLMRLIFDHNTRELIPLSEELEALNLYVELESIRIKNNLEYQLTVSPAIQPQKSLVPPMLLQPIVENSIRHGLVPKASNGRLWVDVSLHNGGLLFDIKDDGVGLGHDVKEGERISGGRVTYDRIEIFNQQRHYTGILEVKERSGRGTQITFSITHITLE